MNIEYIMNSECNNVDDIDSVKNIENKVLNSEVTSREEIETLLKHVILETRKLVTDDINESYINKCDMCQSIMSNYLDRIGIMNYPNMTQHSISDYIVGHSFVVATFKVEDEDVNYLLDPTYKQFLIRDNCLPTKEINLKRMRILSPDPGFYISLADKTLIEEFVYNGFMELTDYNAKVYGDSFYKTKINIPSGFKLYGMAGNIYINSFLKGRESLKDYHVGEIEMLNEDIDIIKLR